MNILKKIWNRITTIFAGKAYTENGNPDNPIECEQLDKIIQEIDNKIKEISERLADIKPIDTPDISTKINESIEKLNQLLNIKTKTIKLTPYEPNSTDIFETILKRNNLLLQFQQREGREAEAKKQVSEALDKIAILLHQDKLNDAKTLILQIQNRLKASYKHEIEQLEKFKQKLIEKERQILIQQQESIRKQREEETKRLQEIEKKRQEEERKKREAEEKQRRIDEEKANQAKQELERLLIKKTNWQEFQKVLQQNGITTLYHFTDRANIKSIKEHGGLFSWHYCNTKGIEIPLPGGGSLSRNLDMRYSLQDYVRVSFTKNHPMMYIAQNDGRIQNPVILTISLDVCNFANSRFANMNATKNGHSQGTNLSNLQAIHFGTVKRPNHFDLDETEKPYYQAEVLVKTWIPIEYITNINEFQI
jgi:hypothetical protein